MNENKAKASEERELARLGASLRDLRQTLAAVDLRINQPMSTLPEEYFRSVGEVYFELKQTERRLMDLRAKVNGRCLRAWKAKEERLNSITSIRQLTHTELGKLLRTRERGWSGDRLRIANKLMGYPAKSWSTVLAEARTLALAELNRRRQAADRRRIGCCDDPGHCWPY